MAWKAECNGSEVIKVSVIYFGVKTDFLHI